MSDWEIDDTQEANSGNQKNYNSSEWELAQDENVPSSESLGKSAIWALPRIGKDIYERAYSGIQKIPGMYEAAKTEIPGAFETARLHPVHSALQGLAGASEAVNSLAQIPSNLSEYGSNRLHLIPEKVTNFIKSISPEDKTKDIQKIFSEPEYPGEKLIRGTFRDIPSLYGASYLKFVNPLKLTNKGIAKSVVNELNNQVGKHTNMYNKLWDKAEKQGFNKVPFDQNALNQDLSIIKKSYTPKQFESINNLLNSPTLANAQKAQSDLGVLRRAIEEKSKTTPLLEGENNIYQALSRAENNIENSMFKNHKGELNNKLANEYRKISKSYRENVVPYRYNPDIQDYLSKDITAKQLIQKLNQGPFAAKKGGFLTHPQFGIRNALLPLLGGIGVLGGGKYLYDQAMGNPMAERQ